MIERTVERVRQPVEVHRADDLAGGDIADPDIAVFTAREKHEFAVHGECDAHEAGVDVDALDLRGSARDSRDQRQRERSGAAIERRQRRPSGDNARPNGFGA